MSWKKRTHKLRLLSLKHQPRVASLHWLEDQLDKYKNPIQRSIAMRCCCSDCNRIAKIKLTTLESFKFYCYEHGVEAYHSNTSNIKELEKARWWKGENRVKKRKKKVKK